MSINSCLELLKPENDRCPILFELIPPEKGNKKKRLKQHTEYLEFLFGEIEVDAFNLPEIQDESQKGDNGKRRKPYKERVSPRVYARELSRRFNAEFIINRVIVKKPHAEQEKWLLETHDEFDLRNIILVGGESSKIEYPGPSVPAGNRLVKKYLNQGERRYADKNSEPTDFTIGNICIPTRRNEDFDETERILQKVKTGADFFTSQIIMEAQTPVLLLDDLSKLLVEEKQSSPLIFWSFSPISSKTDVDFLRWLGVHIPEKVERRILESDNPAAASIEWAQQIWKKIQEFNHQLPQPLPMGINISVMGLRNFKNGVNLAKALSGMKLHSIEMESGILSA